MKLKYQIGWANASELIEALATRLGAQNTLGKGRLKLDLAAMEMPPSRRFYETFNGRPEDIVDGSRRHFIYVRRILRNNHVVRKGRWEDFKSHLPIFGYSSTALTRSIRENQPIMDRLFASHLRGHPYSLLAKHQMWEDTDRGPIVTVRPILVIPGQQAEVIGEWEDANEECCGPGYKEVENLERKL